MALCIGGAPSRLSVSFMAPPGPMNPRVPRGKYRLCPRTRRAETRLPRRPSPAVAAAWRRAALRTVTYISAQGPPCVSPTTGTDESRSAPLNPLPDYSYRHGRRTPAWMPGFRDSSVRHARQCSRFCPHQCRHSTRQMSKGVVHGAHPPIPTPGPAIANKSMRFAAVPQESTGCMTLTTLIEPRLRQVSNGAIAVAALTTAGTCE